MATEVVAVVERRERRGRGREGAREGRRVVGRVGIRYPIIAQFASGREGVCVKGSRSVAPVSWAFRQCLTNCAVPQCAAHHIW